MTKIPFYYVKINNLKINLKALKKAKIKEVKLHKTKKTLLKLCTIPEDSLNKSKDK